MRQEATRRTAQKTGSAQSGCSTRFPHGSYVTRRRVIFARTASWRAPMAPVALQAPLLSPRLVVLCSYLAASFSIIPSEDPTQAPFA